MLHPAAVPLTPCLGDKFAKVSRRVVLFKLIVKAPTDNDRRMAEGDARPCQAGWLVGQPGGVQAGSGTWDMQRDARFEYTCSQVGHWFCLGYWAAYSLYSLVFRGCSLGM